MNRLRADSAPISLAGASPAASPRAGRRHLRTDMLYDAYEFQRAFLSGASAWASVTAELMTNPMMPMGYTGMGPIVASALDVFAHAAMPRGKPQFDIGAVTVDDRSWPVTESIVLRRPFGNLLRFVR